MFTDLEQKLIALALDNSAARGEIDNSAVMLLRSLRARGVTAGELIRHLGNGNGNGSSGPPIYSRPDYGTCVFPWGKHKGEMFMDIKPSYLLWALDWIAETEDKATKWAQLADQIRGFLDQ